MGGRWWCLAVIVVAIGVMLIRARRHRDACEPEAVSQPIELTTGPR